MTAIQSILIGTSGLSFGAVIALALTILRKPTGGDAIADEQTMNIFSIGLAAHCLHCSEEFVTHFPERFPTLLSLAPWSDGFYVVFNLVWLSIWIVSAIGLKRGKRFAYFPAWFFAIGSIANGVGHPVLAIVARGYFSGLITSPLVGVLGVVLFLRLIRSTKTIAS